MSHFNSDEEAHQIFGNDLKELTEKYIRHFGGYGAPSEEYDFMHKKHFKRIRKTLEDILEETVIRFKAKRRRSNIWPFRVEALNADPKFEMLFKELRRHIFKRTDKDVNEEIESYGGKPFSRNKYDDLNMHGNVVVEIDYERIKFNTEIGKRTAQGLIRKMVKSGVLTPLGRTGSQSRWYIYGDWQKTIDSYKVNTRLNRVALREKIEQGLLAQRLIKPKK